MLCFPLLMDYLIRRDTWVPLYIDFSCLFNGTAFRNEMLEAIDVFSESTQNGLFINSCFAHCQSERQDTWFADDSPLLNNKVPLPRQRNFVGNIKEASIHCFFKLKLFLNSLLLLYMILTT